jgi:hypothetical protein
MDTTYNTGCYHINNKPRGPMDHPREVPATSWPLSSCPTAPFCSDNSPHKPCCQSNWQPSHILYALKLMPLNLHISHCNPKISSFLKVLCKGFLKGCPNISLQLVTKYLNPSLATAKGHMKRPKKGIRSTQPKTPPQGPNTRKAPTLVPQITPPVLPVFDAPHPFHSPAHGARYNAHVIPDNQLIATSFALEPAGLCPMTLPATFCSFQFMEEFVFL